MFRATGYRRSLLPWDGRQLRPGAATFAQRPLRLAAAAAIAGLLLGNAVLVYELTHADAPTVHQQPAQARLDPQAEMSDLRTSLEAVEAEIRAEVGQLTVRYQETSERRGRSNELRAGRRDRSGSKAEGGGTAPTTAIAPSAGPPSGSSSESDTGTGSGRSSGGSSGGNTSNDSSSGSSSSGGSGTGSAGAVGGGGAGGGGTGDGGIGGDVSGGGSGGGGGG